MTVGPRERGGAGLRPAAARLRPAHRPAWPAIDGSTRSRGTRSTRPSGITTSTSRQARVAVIAPARAPSSSCRPSPSRPASSPCSSARRRSCSRAAIHLPAAVRWAIAHVPGMQARVARYVGRDGELHLRAHRSRPVYHATAPLVDDVHATPDQGSRAPREALARLRVRVQAQPLQQLLPEGPAASGTSSVVTDVRSSASRRTGVVARGGQEHEVDAIIYGTGSAPASSSRRSAVHGTGVQELQAAWSEAARRAPRHAVHGFPNLFLLYGQKKLTSGSLDRRDDRGAGRLHRPGGRPAARTHQAPWSRCARAQAQSDASAGELRRRHGLDAVRELVPQGRHRAASSATGPLHARAT